ncbi:MAG: helix-turn-helix domain-containing protein [Chthoniobacterales bacterium]
MSELATALGKSPTFVYRALYAGKIRPLADAGRLLISRDQIEAFLARTEEYNPKPKKRITEKVPGEEVPNVAT